MIDTLALVIVVLAGLYLVSLAVASFVAPSQAARFLLGFASTAPLHYLELGLRMIVGCAFVLRAPAMRMPDVFALLGWVLIATTAGLLLVPWTWHRRFSEWSVPHAVRYIKLLGLASFVFGGVVLWASA